MRITIKNITELVICIPQKGYETVKPVQTNTGWQVPPCFCVVVHDNTLKAFEVMEDTVRSVEMPSHVDTPAGAITWATELTQG